jgi:hypothetical protein
MLSAVRDPQMDSEPDALLSRHVCSKILDFIGPVNAFKQQTLERMWSLAGHLQQRDKNKGNTT